MKEYYFIETTIDGQIHYFSHWEMLNPPVFGVVWNEYIANSFGFGSKKQAEVMVERIKKYDPRTDCKIVRINELLIKESQKIVAQLESE